MIVSITGYLPYNSINLGYSKVFFGGYSSDPIFALPINKGA